MTLELSPRTRQLIERLFAPSEQAEVSRWLAEECGNSLPFCSNSDEFDMERIRFAALKVSNGDGLKLIEAIELAKMDSRDLLMRADCGYDLEAHERWAEEVLKG